MTAEERQACVELVEAGARDVALLGQRGFQLLWEEVGHLHAWPPTVLVWPARAPRALETDALFVPDHIMGRVLSLGEGQQTLIVASAATEAHFESPLWSAPILGWLARTPRGRQAVNRYVSRMSPSNDAWSHLLQELLERGVVEWSLPEAAASAETAMASRSASGSCSVNVQASADQGPLR